MPPPPVEPPNVSNARNLYNQAVEANNSGDFARAAKLYYDAYNLDGKIEYLNSYKRSRAREYDALASRAWREENWAAAIKHYQEALSFYALPSVEENLKNARAHQAAAFASQYFKNKDYDLAITYWDQANRISPSPAYLKNIKLAKIAKASSKSDKAFGERRFADLEAAAAEILKLDPTSAYAIELLAAAAKFRTEARSKEGAAGFSDALEGYQRAMAACAEFAKHGGKNGTERMQQLRDAAVANLAKLVHKSGNVDNLVRFYESWGGAGNTARQIISGSIGIALPRPASPQASIPTLPPAEAVRPADMPAIATAIDEATRPSNDEAARPARQPVMPAGPRVGAASNGRDCFDQPCAAPGIRFIPSNRSAPAERETPQLQQLHREIDEIARSIDRVTKSLGIAERTNSWRAPELEQQRDTLSSQRAAKKQEYDNIVHTMQLD